MPPLPQVESLAPLPRTPRATRSTRTPRPHREPHADRGAAAAAPHRATEPSPALGPPRRLALRLAGRVLYLEPEEIEWIEATGDGAVVFAAGSEHRTNDTLATLERRLVAAPFVRTHRSTLVNRDRVRQRELGPYGAYVLVTDSGRRLPVGRSRRDDVRRALEGD